MRKKIAHIIIGLNVGGAELMLKRLVLHGQKDDSFEHCVISLTDLGVIGEALKQEDVSVYSLGMTSFASISKTFIKLRKLLKLIDPDVVQTWMYHADFLGGLAARSLGIKNIIWGIRTTDVSQGASKMTVHLSKVCARLSYYVPKTIVCAAQISKEYHISIGYDESRMKVIPNGFDIEALTATDEDGIRIREEMGISPEDIVVGSIGRFNPVKNQKLFVESAAEVLKEYPNTKFMIIGRDNNRENEKLMSWINTYKLADNFRLLGERKDIPSCLKAMDIFCLHSKTEGFPNVLVEAMSMNVFCISFDVGDAKYIMNDYGLMPISKDKKTLSNSIISTINSPNSVNSRNYIKEKFCIDAVYKKYASFWK